MGPSNLHFAVDADFAVDDDGPGHVAVDKQNSQAYKIAEHCPLAIGQCDDKWFRGIDLARGFSMFLFLARNR